MTSPAPQRTDFSIDVLGRYICNGLDEALRSTDRSLDPDARPFDIIIIGGGSFGSVLASHIFSIDQTHTHRILVLEAGPFLFPEHVQNLPPSLDTNAVWGVPWNSDSPQSWNQHFPGLAFCLGGRSLFWGGWSPYFLDSEIPSPPWPASVIRDLTTPVLQHGGKRQSYLEQAADQIGTSDTNDFIHGELHSVLRKTLFDGLSGRARSTTTLTGQEKDETKLDKVEDLEAPLAVQSAGPRPGFFPFNKFNGVQLLIEAARLAESEAEQAVLGSADARNVKKRLMVVANAHLIRLETAAGRVVRVVTNQGSIDVPYKGKVFLAAGTIENTRITLGTLPNANGLIGRNLMAHLRSNLTFRVKRSDFGDALDVSKHPELKDLQVSALFVKGIHKHPEGKAGHFHFQITASGAGELGTNSESQLFKKIPNIDELDRFADMTDDWIVITVRGIGEIEGDKTSSSPRSRIILDTLGPHNGFDFGQSRALVRLEPSPRDLALWDAMDEAAFEVSKMFANGGTIQYLSPSQGMWHSTLPPTSELRDTLSSTHHESGTLWMGDDPAASVTDDLGRLHDSENLYAVGPCLLPTMGSPNPMLSGVALTRRIGDRLVPRVVTPPLEETFEYIFDGTNATFSKWLQAGGGAFALIDGEMVAQPAGEIGLCYFSRPFGNFTLRLEFKLSSESDNSGVFIRFRNPRLPVPDRNNPKVVYPYNNQAFVGVDTGFEVQIDETARPDGADKHHTGAIYNIPTELGGIAFQKYSRPAPLRVGAWNEYEIEVIDQAYKVRLNGKLVTTFNNVDDYRGKPNSIDADSGFIGFQCESGRVAFRHVRISTQPPRPTFEAEVHVHMREMPMMAKPPKSEKVSKS